MINLAQKLGQSFVNSVFSGVHSNYDKANDAMSLFLHRKWKKKFVEMLGIKPEHTLLDIASGTGDIAKLALQKTQNITISDINLQMLEIAKTKVGSNIHAVVCDASKMPFDDQSYDFITCVFGIRNFENIEQSIIEAKRVLKRQGCFAIMEFMPNAEGNLQNKLYKAYLNKVLPKYDSVFKNEEKSYQYLAHSILTFQTKNEFIAMLQRHNFNLITPSFSFGAVGIFLCYNK